MPAVILVGGFHGDLRAAIKTAEQLRAIGTRVFCFQQGRSDATDHKFEQPATAGGGAFYQINLHVEMVARRLPQIVEAITHYATGGKAALEARDDEPANLLLEQMTAADRMLARNV